VRHYINIFIIKYFRLLAFIFPLLAVLRLSTENHTLDDCLLGVDDWNRYARNAVDIIENGWLMPSINENYLLPSSFFYNYFVAVIFLLFGPSLNSVYLVQSILLSISIILTYNTFFKNTKNDKVVFYGLIVFSYFDIFRYYTFKLLSESLAIFTLSLFFFFIIKSLKKNDTKNLMFSIIFLAICCLTRPTILPFAAILLIILLKKHYLNEKIKGLWVSILIFISLLSSLSIRNYLVTKNNPISIFNDLADKHFHTVSKFNVIDETLSYIMFLIKKVLFLFGFLPLVEPNFNIRPHWIILWLGFFIYVKYYLLDRNKIIYSSDRIIILFVLIYFPTILILTPIESYGFRADLAWFILCINTLL
jgi:hypothetical protein